MADITHNDPVVTESKLTEFYNDIKPFLGCPAYLTSEGNAEYYSTDEKVIGRWTDGKPLYQKVISGNLPSSAGSTGYPHSISNVDEFICVKGIVFWSGHESTEMPVINANSKTPVIFIPSINNSTVLITVDSDRSSTAFAVIIQYTKTTDSASTTIQEDPNEYSTNEKIIGKWIDGKPIYQKTLNIGTLNKGESSVAHNISNFGGLVACFGRCSYGSNGYYLPMPYVSTNNAFCVDLGNVDTTTIGFNVGSNFNSLSNVVVTLQYTKTTD